MYNHDDDEIGADTLFQDPEGFYPEDKQPTFSEHQMLSGQIIRVRLVGSHPLYGNMLWNAGRVSAEYLEENAPRLVANKDVLEIGAAAGVPSIIAAIKGARTVVMTDYSDPDLVDNMRRNAEAASSMIPPGSKLHVAGYKWGADTEEIMSFLPVDTAKKAFDTLIMADVVYSHREHPNLIKTMQETLKRSRDAVALVIFTPYQPWLLPKTEKFFPLAEQNGFVVTPVFEKIMDKALFEDDPGDETLRRTVYGYEIRWADGSL
ncbi:nicotinamide N-methyltransferase Nnt1, putative [Talaromyces stipitatus ATCC 10500]|uniref:Protein N-terminal and lysine N-methyltransferase EFM7 n=1 Tax=Talaromyces stipitatus (strain ATCC 10500 / CBS 375.48 / QM 6759 / NRRL 1006) TaxID=441959 RepID=B8M570_TALSN|nr:nicotinamide N-methyltransferase Nnt1, putative [Talaromyces stipitatus ATCC 10500]EED19676.1 nicotinamide N-methyltransferase Nnt1, putative [Talaromyces stipitatus ATCC 10500]